MSDADEKLARALQDQYDAEERTLREQEAKSEKLAQRLAAASHSMSESDDSAAGDAGPGRAEARGRVSPTYSMSEDSNDEGGAEGRRKPSARSTRPRTDSSPRYSMSDDSDEETDDVRSTKRPRSPAVGAGGPPKRTPRDAGDAAVSSKTESQQVLRRSAGSRSSCGVAGAGARLSSAGSPPKRQTPPSNGCVGVSGAAAAGSARRPCGPSPGAALPYRESDSVGSARETGASAEVSVGRTPQTTGNGGGASTVASATNDGSAPAHGAPLHRKTTVKDRLQQAEPISFFLTKVRSVKSTWRERLSLGLVELLDPSLGELKASLQLNFLVDLDWLLEAYGVYGHQHKPLTVLHGIDPFSAPQSNVTVQKVSMPYPFGTHHTKMMLFEYTEGIRVVIHTSNLVDEDWQDKTQGLWVSPLLPPLQASAGDGEAPTGFRSDLSRYLAAYKLRCLTPWLEVVARHDFSAVRVFFVGSVPGRYQSAAMDLWGHRRVRRLLQKHAVRKNWNLVIQCSSIGRLGAGPDQWLLGELRESLTGGPSAARATVIYPTEENVRNSVEGYDGGSCLPYHHKTHVQQLWLRDMLHQWRSESRGRSGAMPHIKTYTQLSADLTRMAWFMLTSANLSKAAWGATEKQGQQLFIRSYEAGVLFIPKMLGCEFLRAADGDTPAPGAISLPFSLPLTPYGDADKPWFADTGHALPDAMGRTLVRT
ncbi:tyrosyl-DNA phosphodiesterase 1-like [Pollicipes pollicipes]|uniref:tyrosyl-DNA phosphodiesterase 1-like n=1 Tax=Pollicipes pollicipes TaxID=41117 RepID=UPI001885229F|nr:tyrosyl-DNA phosphodiesterase 1-like [Pollicipes pollicipes]